MLRVLTSGLGFLVLAACAELASPIARLAPVDLPRFEAKLQPRGVARANTQIAGDFLELVFRLESGERIPGLLKYDRPVRIALASPGLAAYQIELSALLARLRAEAGIDISQVADPAEADIIVEAVPARALRRAAPGAACFIAPGVRGWADFKRQRWRGRLNWSEQTRLGYTSIFLPDTAPPQEVRDCLHEEIAQALGPVNDLYKIDDTVFNDDNYQSILTPFDMLVLRTLYSPELMVGMPPQVVAARLPGLLARLNPKGRNARPAIRSGTSEFWDRTIETALNRSNRRAERQQAATDAVRLAAAMRPGDHRLGVAYMTLGRLTLRDKPLIAAEAFFSGYEVFRARQGVRDIRTAQAALHLGVIALSDHRPDVTLTLVRQSIPVAEAAENAVLLSGLHALKAAALVSTGREAEAEAARAESLKWARYAFGDSARAIAAAQRQIAAFALKPDADTGG